MSVEQFLEMHLRDNAAYNIRFESCLPQDNEDIYPYWMTPTPTLEEELNL